MKYRLLKDLPDLKAWAIFEQWNTEDTVVNGRYSFYPVGAYESRFEPIKEIKIRYPKMLMAWYIVHFSTTHEAESFDREEMEEEYQMWNRFPTKKKAEAYIALKKDVARFWKLWERYFWYCTEGWRYCDDWDGSAIDYCWQDFSLPIYATEEEKENRVRLLKNYYWF